MTASRRRPRIAGLMLLVAGAALAMAALRSLAAAPAAIRGPIALAALPLLAAPAFALLVATVASRVFGAGPGTEDSRR